AKIGKIMNGRIINGKITGNQENTRIYTKKGAQGGACASQAGAAFSNPFTSELARDSKNTSLSRFANGPALVAVPLRTD
ncbi:MAG: hypothetical protein ACKOF3_09915, partial [Spartobacteria bacterium]